MNKLYENAQKAMDESNEEQALELYEQILLEDPNSWEATYGVAWCSAFLQYKNGETGAAIMTVHDCVENIMYLIRDNIQDETEQKKAASEVASSIDSVCKILYDKSIEEWKDYGDRVISPMIDSNHPKTNAAINENNGIIHQREIAISKTYAALGFKLVEMFGDNCELGKEGISITEKGIDLIKVGTIQGGKFSREKKELIRSYKEQLANLREEVAKRRFKDYWIAHQPEKEALESEKQSLKEQVSKLYNDIQAIPGYTEMLDSLQRLEQDKSKAMSSVAKPKTGLLTFGIIAGIIGVFFTFGISIVLTIICGINLSKKKKSYKAQIVNVESEFENKIQSIYELHSREISQAEAIKKDIDPLENRIGAIDDELTRPR